VVNNVVNITDTAGTALRGRAIQATQGVAGQGATLCANVTGNDVNYSPSPAGVNGIRVRQAAPGGGAASPTIALERRSSASSAASTVLADNNPLSTVGRPDAQPRTPSRLVAAV
jgi:hypothetical protein